MALPIADLTKVKADAKSLVPDLSHSNRKGNCGRVAVVGGSADYSGAPYYAAIAAQKMGVDLVHVICTDTASAAVKCYSPELIVHPVLAYTESPFGEEESFRLCVQWISKMHAVLLGPGLGTDPLTSRLVAKLVRFCNDSNIPAILDAEAIAAVVEGVEDLTRPLILTPNVMEMCTLLATLGFNPHGAVSEAVAREGLATDVFPFIGDDTCIILKGQYDAVGTGATEIEICPVKGCPKRSGGQGDVLAGVLLAWVAWGASAAKEGGHHKCEFGAHELHTCALAASALTREAATDAFHKKHRSMTAPDVIAELGPRFHESFEKSTSI